jgi:hypothetical protein
MELEEMKTLWQQMSHQLEQQKSLTDQLIIEMTQQKYAQKFNKITVYETIGAVICFVIAIAILINFNKLDTWYFMACGIFMIAYLLTLPIIVLRSLKTIKNLKIINKNYKETIVGFAKAKKQLLLVQKLGIYVNVILFLTSIPLASKLLKNKDIFLTGGSLWKYIFIAIVAILMIFVSRWGYNCYKNVTNSAENVLKDIEN